MQCQAVLYLMSIMAVKVTSEGCQSVCGYLPEPHLAVKQGRFVHTEGAVVDYKCKSYENFPHQLTCHNGNWVGERIRCGQKVDIVVMKVDIKNNSTNKMVSLDNPDWLVTNRQWMPTQMNNSILDGSASWTLHLNQSVNIGFVRLELFRGHRGVGEIGLHNMKLSSNNTCKQMKSSSANTNYANRRGTVTSYWFECPKQNGSQAELLSDMIHFESNTDAIPGGQRDAVLYELSIAEPVSRCGRPEDTYFTEATSLPDGSVLNGPTYKLKCRNGFKVVELSAIYCDGNGQWQGTFPKCQPAATCRPLELRAHKIAYSKCSQDGSQSYFDKNTVVFVTCHENGDTVNATCDTDHWNVDISCTKPSSSSSKALVFSSAAVSAICIGLVVVMAIYTARKAGASRQPQAYEYDNYLDLNRYSTRRGPEIQIRPDISNPYDDIILKN
ncbi:hypothetical protein HDE_00541 [Halotydeus destructor]|nr:hypothetical protein HDE_00541 [Halotydeus destructor]